MKKVIGIMIIVISICAISLSMTACGSEDNGEYLNFKGVDQSGYIPEEVTINDISVLADPLGNYSVLFETNGTVFERAMSTKAGQYTCVLDPTTEESYQVIYEGKWYNYQKVNGQWVGMEAEGAMQNSLASLGALFDPEKYVQDGDLYYYTGSGVVAGSSITLTVEEVRIQEGKLIISLRETYYGRTVYMTLTVSDFGTTRIAFPNNLPKPTIAAAAEEEKE